MSKSQTAFPSQPSISPPAIPNHLLSVFELISKLEPVDCWRLGAPALLMLGIVEPTLFRNADPPEIGEMFRKQIKPTQEWFQIAEDLGRIVIDHKLLATALMRIAAVRLVGS